MVRSDLEEKIRDYAIDEGVLGKQLPANPKIEFGYEILYPPKSPRPMVMTLIKPLETKAVTFQVATQIAPQHVEALKKLDSNGIIRFFEFAKKYLLNQNLLYNLDVNNCRYAITESIYPDGLTENSFYYSIRKVFNASLYLNIIIMEMCTGKSIGASLGKDELEFGGGNSMYT